MVSLLWLGVGIVVGVVGAAYLSNVQPHTKPAYTAVQQFDIHNDTGLVEVS